MHRSTEDGAEAEPDLPVVSEPQAAVSSITPAQDAPNSLCSRSEQMQMLVARSVEREMVCKPPSSVGSSGRPTCRGPLV